jgi:hypothetical protein
MDGYVDAGRGWPCGLPVDRCPHVRSCPMPRGPPHANVLGMHNQIEPKIFVFATWIEVCVCARARARGSIVSMTGKWRSCSLDGHCLFSLPSKIMYFWVHGTIAFQSELGRSTSSFLLFLCVSSSSIEWLMPPRAATCTECINLLQCTQEAGTSLALPSSFN